jgi:hypothetical protein
VSSFHSDFLGLLRNSAGVEGFCARKAQGSRSAMLGTVQTGGGAPNSKEQAPAQITHAPKPPDAERTRRGQGNHAATAR